MHSPETVICDFYGLRGLLKLWRLRRAQRRDEPTGLMQYPDSLATLWHVDPETDGSDDSCGFSYPRVSEEERERVAKAAKQEWAFTFGEYPELKLASHSEVIHAVWSRLAWTFDRRRSLTARELDWILSLASNPTDNLRHIVFEAKYDEKKAERLWQLVYRQYKHLRRPWYRKPRWHVHHWRLQVHALRNLKRFLFSRCEKCGGRFTWHYAPVSKTWHGTGPQWFKSEKHVFHHDCAA